MDAIDIKILDMLQENGRLKRSTMAEEVGLSLPSLSERLKKLEERDIIQGYYAKVNKNKFGLDIMAFINVFMDSSKSFDKLSNKVERADEILECHSILGSSSHILKALVKNTSELEALLSRIQSWPGVSHTVSSFVLSTIKETTKIKLEKE